MTTRTALRLTAIVLIAGVVLTGCVEVTVTEKPDLASDAAASTDVSLAKLAVISYLSVNGSLPSSAADLAEWGYLASAGVSPVVIHPGSNNTFCVDATAASGTVFKAGSSITATAGACSSADVQ